MGLEEISRSTMIIGAIVSVLIGIAFCFFGYRIFRVLLGVLGFIGGAAAGVGIVTAILAQQGTTSGQTLYQILGGLVGGAIGAVLMIFLYIIGIFGLGALLGAGLGYAIASLLTKDETSLVVVLATLGMAVVGGVLAIILQRAIIIISTAVSGAASIVSGVTLLVAPGRGLGLPLPAAGPLSSQFQGTTAAPVPTASIVALVAWIVLAIAGMVVQFVWTGKKKPKPVPVGAVPYGTVVGATPQINVTVNQQQHNAPAPVAYQPPVQQPPIIVQAPPQPMATPVIVQAPERAVPLMPMPEQPALPAAAANGAAGMGRFCPNCGQPMSAPVSFCPSCGAPVAALWQ